MDTNPSRPSTTQPRARPTLARWDAAIMLAAFAASIYFLVAAGSWGAMPRIGKAILIGSASGLFLLCLRAWSIASARKRLRRPPAEKPGSN